ncbi:MAG: hypothetical protein FJ387_09670 [Verrucomicrobia bacterium]|nr:hypothetical protein [Verrucomicrobiota bacterium]
MRVTFATYPTALIGQLGDLTQRQARLQTQAASGQRYQNPAENPLAARRIAGLDTEAKTVQQYQRNLGTQQQLATATFDVLRGLKTISDRAQEIATLADGAKSTADLQTLGHEVTQLIRQAVQWVNTKHQGAYLFAGTDGRQAPFREALDAAGRVTNVTYHGNADVPATDVSEGTPLTVHIPGENRTGAGQQGLLADTRTGADLFAHLISLQDHLLAGDTAAIAATDRPALQRDEDNLIQHYSVNGSVQARLEAQLALLKSRSSQLAQARSTEADADLAETLVQLTATQNAYRAALQTGSLIMNQSLLDFLR